MYKFIALITKFISKIFKLNIKQEDKLYNTLFVLTSTFLEFGTIVLYATKTHQLETLINMVLCFTFIRIVAVTLNKSVRQEHYDTFYKCYVTSVGLFIVFLIISNLTNPPFYISSMYGMISGIIMVRIEK